MERELFPHWKKFDRKLSVNRNKARFNEKSSRREVKRKKCEEIFADLYEKYKNSLID